MCPFGTIPQITRNSEVQFRGFKQFVNPGCESEPEVMKGSEQLLFIIADKLSKYQRKKRLGQLRGTRAGPPKLIRRHRIVEFRLDHVFMKSK